MNVNNVNTWYLYKMVAQNMLRTYDVKQVILANVGFDNSFDVTKCLQQIEIPDLLCMCALWNEQPTNIETMVNNDSGSFDNEYRGLFYKHTKGLHAAKTPWI